jgi:hypothetical protein
VGAGSVPGRHGAAPGFEQRLLREIVGDSATLGAPALVQALWDGDPPIAVKPFGTGSIARNPQSIENGEDTIVIDALRKQFGG